MMIRAVAAPEEFNADELLSLVETDGVRIDSTDVVSLNVCLTNACT